MAAARLLVIVFGALLAGCGSGSPVGANPSASAHPTTTPPVSASSEPALPPGIPVAGGPPAGGQPWFLAVGDSVTFGTSADPARAGHNDSWPVQLQALLAGRGQRWQLFDTACPGETTVTYTTRCPHRDQVPFLADASQRSVVLAAVAAHRADLRLILVDLGSNDLLRAQRAGSSADQVATALRVSLTTIVGDLAIAAPGVPLVVANYYDPLENSVPATLPQLQVVNGVVASIAAGAHAALADFFAAINTRSAPAPSLCLYVDCAHLDVHPTVAGHARLARAALAVIPPG
jgi:lysophospholipase L1-like esterase